eukprot:434014-Rhodomonas_salina.1
MSTGETPPVTPRAGSATPPVTPRAVSPTADSRSGETHCGKKPSGKKARTKKPSMSTKQWIKEFKIAMKENDVLRSTNKNYVSLHRRLEHIKRHLRKLMQHHGIQKYTVTTTDNHTLDEVVKHCYDELAGYECFGVILEKKEAKEAKEAKDPKEAADKKE